MKKSRNLLACLLVFIVSAACADNDRPIATNQLPQPAQQLLKQHFGERKIVLTKMETDFAKKSYDVIFADGCQIEFDSKGDWREVDCKFSEVPAAIIPAPILEYATNHYPDAKIVKIEKDRREYEVKLSNRLELTFDRYFNLIDMDD